MEKDTLSYKCLNIDTVGSFCDCIAGDADAAPAARSFCGRAKTDANVTREDLVDLKSALLDVDGEECCDCCG
jgi:hypothetical protein